MKSVRIGNGCGFWGDNLDAPFLLARDGQLDYLTLEYLAELTMSILALLKQRDAKAGYATDFIDVLTQLAPLWKQQPNLKVVTNAGGMNPLACAEKARTILDQQGLSHLRIGVVTGDDLFPRLDALLTQGEPLHHLDHDQPLSLIRSQVVSANAYLGAKPIVEALSQGAAIVITGRVADASLTVGPAMFEHGWSWQDWDRLSAATVAGHLIECGAQVTGGLWCHWQETDLTHVGYPIASMDADGLIRLSKPANTGGTINIETVAEQLLYEVGDPRSYLTPDVTADFTTVELQQVQPDVVEIRQAHGREAPSKYKVSIAYRNGFTSSGTLVIHGPKARDKARKAGEMLLKRLKRAGYDYAATNIECIGSGDVVPGVLPVMDPPEVLLRVSVRDTNKAAVERFTKEFAPLVTSGPPGVTGYTTGRPAVREVFAYWPALIDPSMIEPRVMII